MFLNQTKKNNKQKRIFTYNFEVQDEITSKSLFLLKKKKGN